MEQIVNLHIEKLPEGVYLATSDEVQGLIAQGRTITETLEIARDVAKKLLESQGKRQGQACAGSAPGLAPSPTRGIGNSEGHPEQGRSSPGLRGCRARGVFREERLRGRAQDGWPDPLINYLRR